MNRTRKRTRRKRISPLPILVAAALLLLIVVLIIVLPGKKEAAEPEVTEPPTEETTAPTENPYLSDTPEERLVIFARENGLSLSDWPEGLLELIDKNPDAEEFVRDYPFRDEIDQTIDLSDQVGTGKVPLLYQWDKRWGYSDYGGNFLALTGCGPTCLSMVSLYFLGDAKYTPRYVADYSEENGHYAKGAGTSWSLMSKGAKDFGLNVDTIPPNPSTIMKNLEAGNLVICAMGPGIFTEFGHFILLAGAQDGKAIVHDPNSSTKSAMLWDVSEFSGQISMLWVYKPIEE